MVTNIELTFNIDVSIFNMDGNKEDIKLLFNEDNIMRILFRFAPSDNFIIHTVDNKRSFCIIYGYDEYPRDKELTHIILSEIKDGVISDKYFVNNYIDFMMELMEAFIQIHSIGKYATLISSTIKSTIENNNDNNIPDEFEVPNITDINKKYNNEDDYEEDEEYTDYDNKLTDYSESSDF